MNFSKVKSLTIPEGNVAEITCDGVVLWSAIPAYHYVESARVAEEIQAWKAAHPNNLIFGAVSDIHVYNGEAGLQPTWTKDYANPSDQYWLQDTRLNSSNTTSCPGMTTTNYIDTQDGDIVRVANFNLDANLGDSSKVGAVSQYIQNNLDTCNSRQPTRSSNVFISEASGVYSFQGVSGYLRFCGVPTNGDENVIITINEEITYTTIPYEARSKTAIKNAAFALEMVGAMAECDFIANLGDNCWENGIDTDNALLGAKYSINALKPAFDRLTSFNLVGNHDKSDYTEAQHNLIGVHNDFDVASSTVIRGFGYKDYTDKKVRVIVLNTCDYLNASGGCAMSYEQKDFLMRALDLTEIADKGWQILLLSHIPLDWNGGDYNFYADLQTILKAYENGTTASIAVNSSYALNETPSNYATYTGGTLVYDYSGLNSAKIIANIHGHVHTNKVSKIANTNIARVATANTNPDLNKTESYPTYGDYSISTTEAAKIVKVSGTAKDTSATFYCIDLDEQTIYAYGYGADIDRTIIYKDDTPTYTNVIDTVGTEDNVRLRSGGATASAAGFASNYFPAKGGDIIRVYFPNGSRASIPSNGVYCCTYSDTSGTLVTAYDSSTSSTVLKNATDTGYEIHIPTSVNCSYARVAGGPNGAYTGWIVTVNEEIT